MRLILLALVLFGATGCNAGLTDHLNFWPFNDRERTSYRTPPKQIAQLRTLADLAATKKPGEQEQIANDLALGIQGEEDPLLREEILRTIAKYPTATSKAVLQAGLKDNDARVREAACQLVAERHAAEAIPALAEILRSDTDQDVRLAAARALGKFPGQASVDALAIALDDQDVAMQYRAVEALRQSTGKELGNDVAAWRAFVKGETPPEPKTISIADQIRKKSPF